jgi:hypothetical protein
VDEITVTFLEEDEEPPADTKVWPALDEMEPTAAIRHLMEDWCLDVVDAHFYLPIARGETDGDAYAVDDNGNRVRTPRQTRTPA